MSTESWVKEKQEGGERKGGEEGNELQSTPFHFSPCLLFQKMLFLNKNYSFSQPDLKQKQQNVKADWFIRGKTE